MVVPANPTILLLWSFVGEEEWELSIDFLFQSFEAFPSFQMKCLGFEKQSLS